MHTGKLLFYFKFTLHSPYFCSIFIVFNMFFMVYDEAVIWKRFSQYCSFKMPSGTWRPFCFGLSALTHWDRDKIAAISQTRLSNPFSWMKMFEFRLKLVPNGPIDNVPALVQIMAWRRPGDKSLSEPMKARLLTRICVTRPQWVKTTVSEVL